VDFNLALAAVSCPSAMMAPIRNQMRGIALFAAQLPSDAPQTLTGPFGAIGGAT